MDQYKKCIPLFTYRDQALIITKTGFGTVTSSDQKINCGSDCNGTYPYGTKVTLTAIPDPNRKFISWGDGCGVSYLNKNDPTITVTMDKTANCVANFSNGYLLTIQKEGSGTVTGAKDKLNCGSTCVAEFSAGSNFNIYAKEDPGWVLVKWEGDCSGSISNANITMDKDKTCKVIFTNQFQFYTSVIKGGGKITSSDGKINCNTAEACSAVYTSGTQVTLTATPDSGKKFDYWSGVCTGTNPTITTTVTLNKKYCYAYFK
jgi:hypothetical protein